MGYERVAEEAMGIIQGRVPLPATVSGPSQPVDIGAQRTADQAMAMIMRDEGNLTDDELAARWVKQDKVEGPGIPSLGFRGRMSFFGETFEERAVAFERAYPTGGYQEVPNTDIVLYRKTPEDDWKKADPGFLESWGKDYFAKEFGLDLADFAGDLPEAAGEAAAFLATKGRVKMGTVRSLFTLASGAMAGSAAQQGAQYLAGTQRQSIGEQSTQALTEGGYSLIGGTLGAALGGGINVVRRRAVMKELRPGAREAMESAERIGTPTIPLTQLSDSPFIMRMGRQASSLWRGLARASRMVEEHSAKMMDALVDKGSRLKFMEQAERAAKVENRLIRETTEEAVKYMRKHPRTRGRILQERISDWWNNTSKQAVDDAYRVARSIEEPDFDIEPLRARARELQEGIVTPDPPKTVMVDTGEVDEAGRPVLAEEIKTPLRRLDPLGGNLKKLVKDILAIDPELPYVTEEGVEIAASKTDRLRALQKRARDLALPEPGGGMREPQLQAASLAAEIKGILDNPTSTNATFRSAWRRANKMAADRFDTREHLAVVDALRSGTPSEIVDNLLINRKATIDNLIAIRRASDAETFEEIRSEFVRKLFNEERVTPGGMGRALDEMEPKVLRMLLPKHAQRLMRNAANRYGELASTNIRRAMERQTELAPFIQEVLDNPLSAGLDALHKLVLKQEGGVDSTFGQTVRAAVMDEIIRRSSVTGKAGGAAGLPEVGVQAVSELGTFDRISGKQLHETIKEFHKRGLTKFLKKSDLAQIRDVETVQKLMDIAGTDAGTALVGAQTIKGVSQLSMNAIADLAHYFGVSRLLMKPSVIRLVAGSASGGRPGIDTRGIQALGAIFASFSRDMTRERDIPEYNALLGKPQEAPK
jgi:hypothetical protein